MMLGSSLAKVDLAAAEVLKTTKNLSNYDDKIDTLVWCYFT